MFHSLFFPLSDATRKYVKVVLCGEGSDELLLGYRHYKRVDERIGFYRSNLNMLKEKNSFNDKELRYINDVFSSLEKNKSENFYYLFHHISLLNSPLPITSEVHVSFSSVIFLLSFYDGICGM